MCQALERVRKRRLGHAALGDDGGDVAGGGDVEGRVLHLHVLGGDAGGAHVRDLARRALLDGNLGAVGRLQINGGKRRGHVEGDAVLLGQHGDGVGADLVGGIAVGGDAVGAHHHGADLALGHHGAGHVVGDHGGGDAVLLQLPGGEARALEEGAGLVGVDVELLAALDGGADYAQSGAVAAGGGQRARVAVGENLYVSLILYTTQQFGERATISKWNEATSKERLEILEAIHRQAEERESERQNETSDVKPKTSDVLLLQRLVLDLSRRDKLNQVIERFVIEACSPTLPELHTLIKQQYIKGILDGKKDDFLDSLIGFITQAPATREQRWEITYDNFDKKVGDLNNIYCRETRAFPRKHFDSAKLPNIIQMDAHRDHAFVQKIQDIEHLPAIPKAVRDYLGAVQTINEEFKNYEVPPSRTKNYADELVQIFEARYSIASRKCMDIIADSQDFFENITVEEPREFEGFDRPPMAFRNGLLHTQLDDLDKDLQWRLKNI